ncbi:hypothetical protein FRUB_08411 [Fimbriiglobus ruber]|uniref:Uncharacterized protein n=1 Tax=Fimbriiglobus ruber TaxID=1908690 RepID=A0A225DBE6_9BACT|nr:hypothetical protein FRUB_08411 [Fimbriiglobus ruber]
MKRHGRTPRVGFEITIILGTRDREPVRSDQIDPKTSAQTPSAFGIRPGSLRPQTYPRHRWDGTRGTPPVATGRGGDRRDHEPGGGGNFCAFCALQCVF